VRVHPVVTVDDPSDPRIADFVGLRDHELRRRREAPGGDLHGRCIAEGDLVVTRALRAGFAPLALLVDDRVGPVLTGPLADLVPEGTPVFGASPAVLDRITGIGVVRGVLACLARRPVPDAAEVLARSRRVVALEGVNNPVNVGLVARSAAGLGLDALCLDATCADPLYRRAARVAMGEVYAFPYAWLPAGPAALATLHDAGFTTLALTPDADATPISTVVEALTGTATTGPATGAPGPGATGGVRLALVVGAEGPGLHPGTLAGAHHRVRIPMHAGVDSLNAAVATAIACYELTRAR
jgi:tRNA G18 (ribose-2'-O)-methylase SpoU